MNNYIITNDTIAILKKKDMLYKYDVENLIVFNRKLKKTLDENCMFYGSNLEGRKKYVKSILNIKYKIPILISKENKIILIPINNLRRDECLLIAGDKIVNYQVINNKIIIQCINNKEFTINMSKNSFERLLINYLILKNNLS